MSETQGTSKNKKIILISVVAIVLIVIVGLIWYFVAKEKSQEQALKLNQFYEDLQSKDTYSFTTTLNDENKMYYATQENKAYISTIYKGTESEFIIKAETAQFSDCCRLSFLDRKNCGEIS